MMLRLCIPIDQDISFPAKTTDIKINSYVYDIQVLKEVSGPENLLFYMYSLL